MTGDEGRLRRLIGGPETAWIVERARTRLSRGRPLTGAITLANASAAQRAAVGRLLGRVVAPGRSVSIPLERLDAVLRESGAWPEGLASAVIVLAGPVADPEQQRAEEEAWRAVGEALAALAESHPALTAWAEGLRARGHLRRVTANAPEAMALLREVAAALDALPADGESIAHFSARVLHRAHALDAGTALGGLAASAADAVGNAAASDRDAAGAATSRPGSAAWRREAWASVGVLVDDLSSTVLVVGLPGAPAAVNAAPSGTARALAALASSGEPTVLTLRQVVADDLGTVPPVVHVCENPAVVSAAADLLGPRTAPLVCLQGQPGAAAVTLLRRLQEGGAALRYHGDFDWGGVTIARTLTSHVAWAPWRFGAADYLAALERRGRTASLATLRGRAQETPWDPALRTAMIEHGVGVEEELVLEELLEDLAAG